jgi:hypothetical protein
MNLLFERRRTILTVGAIIVAVAIAALAASTTGDAVAISVAIALVIAGVAAITSKGVRATHPVFTRAA